MNTAQANHDRRARDIFLAALDKPDSANRAGFIEGACGGDGALRAAVEALLINDVDDKFLEQAPATVLAERQAQSAVLAEVPGSRLGRYKILQKIGEGGCGVVYMAEQEEPVRRRVALKVIKLGMDTKSVIARFEAERQALAMMDHANIAKVLDAGATETGRPYFVMELVRGVKITEYCDQHKLPPRQRLELFVKVCQAIQHAHQKGIIHRDIKPSNILVTVNDGVAVPKVIDFGIAKATEGRLTNNTLFTAFEQFIGTPAYMSPEQAVMTSLDIDTRSDIYSLGVLLYELLNGKTPFDPTELMKAGLDELRRTIRDQEPPRPSTRLTQELVAAGLNKGSGLPDVSGGAVAGRQLQDLVALLRGDLDWIVMKCLEKDRQRRYETANGLAADIERHLHNEPIVARPPSATYRFQKLVRRNKLAFAAGGAIAAALVIGIAVSTWQAVVAIRAREVADAALAAEARERSAAQTERSTAQTERDRAQAAQAQAEKEKLAAERNAYAAAMLVARMDWDNANLSHLHQVLEETSSYPEKGFEWFYWQRMCRSELMTLRDHDSAITAVCFSPDGSRIASASADHTARVWDAGSGHALLTLRGHAGEVLTTAFSMDGRRLITAAKDNTVRIWDASSGKLVHTFRGIAGALAPDGQSLFIADSSGQVALQEVSTGRELANLGEHEHEVRTLTFSSDGTKVLSASARSVIQLWKLDETPRPKRLWLHESGIWEPESRPAAFSPDGQRIVCGGFDRIVRIWDTLSRRELKALTGHGEQVCSVAFSPDGRRVASGSLDRTIKVWDSENGTELLTLKGHAERVTSVAFSPDGQRLVTGSQDRTIRIWDSSAPVFPRISGGEASREVYVRFAPTQPQFIDWRNNSTNALQLVRFSPDGRQLLTASKDRTVRIWDSASLKEIRVLRGHTDVLSHANFSPDGKLISCGSHDGELRLWDAARGKELRVWRGNSGTVLWSKVSQDGTKVVSTAADGFLRIRDTSTGEELRSWKAHEGAVWCVEYSPDEQRLATCGNDGIIKIWDPTNGRELMALRGHSGQVIPLAFSPDGKKIVSGGGADRTIRVWDASDGRELLVVRGHVAGVWDVSFSPDGRRLVSAAYDKSVRLWDASNGRELLTLRGNSDYLMAAAFSPDGTRLACAGDHPSFELWETAAADEVSRWRTEEVSAAKRWAAWDQLDKAPKNAGRADLIKSWLILAPIPLAANKNSLQQISAELVTGESQLRPYPEQAIAVGSQHLKWNEARFEDGIIDFNRFVGGAENSYAAAYAVCYVRSAQARQGLCIKAGSDDQSRIYLNGKLIHEYPFDGPLSLNINRDTVVGVDLQAGVNVVVFKVINGVRAWLGTLRFVDEHDNPVQGLEFTTSPD